MTQDQDQIVIDASNRCLDHIYDLLQKLEQINVTAPYSVVAALVGHCALSFPDPERWFQQCIDDARMHYHATMAPILAERAQATLQ